MTTMHTFDVALTLANDGQKYWSGTYVADGKTYGLGTNVSVADLEFNLAQLFRAQTGSIHMWDGAHVCGDLTVGYDTEKVSLKFEFVKSSYYLKDGDYVKNGGNLKLLIQQYLAQQKQYTSSFTTVFSNLHADINMWPWGVPANATPLKVTPVVTVKTNEPSPPSSPDAPLHSLFDDDDF